MKAWVLKSIGQFEYCDVELPSLGEGDVLLRVKCAGICGSDIPRIFTNGAHRMPLIIGHEFSGVVENIGKNVNPKWLGANVGVFPLIPCKVCEQCKNKEYEMCTSYNYLGSRCNGGFADYVVVPEWNLLNLSETITFEQAAMLEPMAVAVHAMRKATLNDTDAVVVWGAGTIGLLLTMFLVNEGITPLVIGNHKYQKEYVSIITGKEDSFCHISNNPEKWLLEKTDGRGVNVFFECVGKTNIIEKSLNVVSAGGQIVLVGNPAGEVNISKELFWKILRKQFTIRGIWNSSFYGERDIECGKDDWHYVLTCLEKGEIHPEILISHRIRNADLDKGISLMKNKTEPYIKIMGIIDDEKGV